MSEKLHDLIRPESTETLYSPEHKLGAEKQQSKEGNQEHKENKAPDIAEIQERIEQAARPSKDITVETREPDSSHYFVDKELKTAAFHRTMARVRRKLSSPERLLSKTVHQPAVDAISNAGAKTIARPSGILAGGVVALFGTSFVLYMAKHYGFAYSRSLVIVLFAAGYIAGIVLEMCFRLLRSKRR